MSSKYIYLLCFFSSLCLGKSSKTPTEITEIKLVYSNAGRNRVMTVPLASLKVETSYNALSPHPELNPKKQTSRWEGVTFRNLLQKNQVPFSPTDRISVVGGDHYIADHMGDEFLKFDGMIAFRKDGKKVEWYEGGAQTIYPTTDPKLPDDFRLKGSYWVWSVAAVLVGDLLPVIEIEQKNSHRTIDLSKHPKRFNISSTLSFPIGFRPDRPKPESVSLGVLGLQAVLGKSEKPLEKIEATTYYGEVLTLDKDFDKYFFYHSFQGGNIPTRFGGPVQLCYQQDGKECLYFVKAIKVHVAQ